MQTEIHGGKVKGQLMEVLWFLGDTGTESHPTLKNHLIFVSKPEPEDNTHYTDVSMKQTAQLAAGSGRSGSILTLTDSVAVIMALRASPGKN